MDFSFHIPRQNKDLLDGDGNSFFVKNVYTPNEITSLLKSKTFFVDNFFCVGFAPNERRDKLN